MKDHSATRVTDGAFRRIVERMPAAAYTCDAAGLITWFNRRAADIWGREPRLNDPSDRYCGSFRLFTSGGVPVPHDECWMARALKEDRDFVEQEIVIERPDGSRWVALAHASPLHDEAGALVAAVNVLVDITVRKRAEEELLQADRQKSEFLAMLAHELRNPLAPLRNGLQILRLAGDPGGKACATREMMERQLGQMVRLIDDLLDLSRITNGQIELRRAPVSLVTVVHDALETCRPGIEAAGHELVVHLPVEPAIVHADRARLAQVFANLLNNSARYTPRGGRIWLTVERQGSDAVVSVRDTGRGIPPGHLARIFELFARGSGDRDAPEGGLGIGLSLVRRLVELHGGTVEAFSEGPGRGSEFVVRLAALLEPVPAGGGGERAVTLRSRSRRILVVDDNEDAASSLATLLQLTGHEAACAHDGLAAVEAAKRFLPHVVLLDIGLPKLNGYDACRSIRCQPWSEGMVLVALTGWAQDEDRRRSREAGFDFHLVKPVDPGDLERLLAGLVAD